MQEVTPATTEDLKVSKHTKPSAFKSIINRPFLLLKILISIILITGVISGVYLVFNSQEVRRQASVGLPNLVSNGEFTANTNSWQYALKNSGKLSFDSKLKSARVTITNPGRNMQLFQTGITLKAGVRYRISFDAKSSDGSGIKNIILHKHGTPYTTYASTKGPNSLPKQNESLKRYTYEVTTSKFGGVVNDVRLRFWLVGSAKKGTTYWIDNVRLEEIGGLAGGSLPPTTPDRPISDQDKPPVIPSDPTLISDVPTPTVPPVAGKKTKKWNPGHYLRVNSRDPDPERIREMANDPAYSAIKGFRIMVFWKTIEPTKGNYNWSLIDKYLAAVRPDQHVIIHFWERDLWNNKCNASTGIPGYMLPMTIRMVNANGVEGPCLVRFWEDAPRNELVRVLNALGKRYNDNPKFEGIMFDETAFGRHPTLSGGAFNTIKLKALKDLHSRISDAFSKSQVIQSMNYLGGSNPCENLTDLTEHLRRLGHGVTNPDTVPWKGLPWDCEKNGPYNFPEVTGTFKISNPIPVYAIYRKYKGQIPIVLGNDTSQLLNPLSNPSKFNEVPMNADNLVDALYKMSTGYLYKPKNIYVDGFGANYITWNTQFWSNAAGSTTELNRAYKDAVSKLTKDPKNKVDTTCPKSINCL